MAAAVTEESFEDCWFSEEHVMSESGIVMGKEVLCELILNKIRKIQKSKARADSNAVCKGLSQGSWPRRKSCSDVFGLYVSHQNN